MSRHYLKTHRCTGSVLESLCKGWERAKLNPDATMDLLHSDDDLTQQLAAQLPKMLAVKRGKVFDLAPFFHEVERDFWLNKSILQLTEGCEFWGDTSKIPSPETATGINPIRRLAFARLGCTPRHKTARDALRKWVLGNRWHMGFYTNLLVFNYFVRIGWIPCPAKGRRVVALGDQFGNSFVVWQGIDEFGMDLDICAPKNTVYLVGSNNVSDG